MHFLIFTKNLSLQLLLLQVPIVLQVFKPHLLLLLSIHFYSLNHSGSLSVKSTFKNSLCFWLVVCKVIVNVFCNATLLFWRVVCKVNFLEFFVLRARCL